MKILSFTLLFILLFIACAPSGQNHKELVAPEIETTSEEVDVAVDYSDVQPIFDQYCAACHPSLSRPNWQNYDEAAVYAENGLLVRRVIEQRSMPPPASPQAAAMQESDRALIQRWVESGFEETSTKIARTEISGSPSADPVIGPAMSDSTTEFIQSCISCHQVNVNRRGDIPLIAGQNLAYLKRQLFLFKWLDRMDPSFEMNRQALNLTNESIDQLAEYFSQLAPPKVSLDQQELKDLEVEIARGRLLAEISCDSCHSNTENNGRPISELVPSLNGQPREYLRKQLILYQKGYRKNATMQTISERLSSEDLTHLSIYYSNQP